MKRKSSLGRIENGKFISRSLGSLTSQLNSGEDMGAIKRYLTGLLLGKWVKPIIGYLDGKKTILGAITLVLWVWIYAIPQLWPELAYLADWGKQIRDLLEAQGIALDKELLGTGMGLTLIGLLDKLRKLFST